MILNIINLGRTQHKINIYSSQLGDHSQDYISATTLQQANYRRVLQSTLSCEEPERNKSNKRHDDMRLLSLGHLSFRI